ncbi:MAG: TlpA family protein disulfide reductase [Fimbriimonas sp.]
MIKKPLTFALAAVLALGSSLAFGQNPEKFEGKKIPAFTMKDTTGKTVSDKSLRGKLVLIDFWATWCAPCVAASPMINRLHQKYAKQGLVVIGANISDKPGSAAAYKKEHKYGYAFTTGGEKLAAALGVQGIPAFIFVDRTGKIVDVQTGTNPGLEAQFDGTVKRMLGKK